MLSQFILVQPLICFFHFSHIVFTRNVMSFWPPRGLNVTDCMEYLNITLALLRSTQFPNLAHGHICLIEMSAANHNTSLTLLTNEATDNQTRSWDGRRAASAPHSSRSAGQFACLWLVTCRLSDFWLADCEHVTWQHHVSCVMYRSQHHLLKLPKRSDVRILLKC